MWVRATINMLLVIVLVIAVFIWLVYSQSIIQRICELWGRYKFAKTMPGPGFFSILNNASAEKALAWVTDLSKTYGSVYRVWFAQEITVFVSDPEYLKVILTSNNLLEKSTDYTMLEHWLGKGLLTNGGASWHQQRKLLTTAFHFKILGSFKGQIEDCCDILINQLSALADGKSVIDIHPYVSLFSLDVICETAMGVKSYAQMDSHSEYVKATNTMCEVTTGRMFSMWLQISLLFNLSSSGKKSRDALKVLNGKTRSVIAQRRSEFDVNSIQTRDLNNTDDSFGNKKKYAFLDSLLLAQREGAQLSDKMVEDEVNTFMFEGHDTTSSALSFAIYELSRNQDCQACAREDVLEAGGDMDRMLYLEAFIKETLRLYPSVPMYSRNVVEPFSFGPYVVPKSVTIAILASTLHRDPTLYPDPDTFNPERFLGGASSSHPFSFLAFSAGPRNCIGQRFAMLELKCALSKLLQAFDVLPVDGFEPKLTVRLVMFSLNGIQIRLSKRTK